MDRNDRARRHKQAASAVQRRHDPHRMNRQAPPVPRQAPPPRQTAYADHAPLFDQDHGRPAPVPAEEMPPRRRRMTQKARRRRARRRRMLAVLLVLAAIVAGVVFSLSFLFKVTGIVVTNPGGGSEWIAVGQTNVIPVTPAATPAPAGSAAADPDASAPPSAPEGDAASSALPGASSSSAAAEPEAEASPVPQPTEAPAAALDTGPYSARQIAAALGVQPGDTLFSFDLEEKQQQMDLALPLLEQIELRRKYPNTIEICVTPASASYCLQTDTGWLLLSRTLKVMELSAEQPAGLTRLYAKAVATTPGTALMLKDEVAPLIGDPSSEASSQAAAATRPLLEGILQGLQTYGLLEKATALDLTNPEEAAFLYDDRICVRLGTLNELDYKMQLAAYIVLNKNGDGCSATDIGDLDCSYIRADGTIQPVFRQGAPLLPVQQAELEAAQQAGEGADPQPDAAASQSSGQTGS